MRARGRFRISRFRRRCSSSFVWLTGPRSRLSFACPIDVFDGADFHWIGHSMRSPPPAFSSTKQSKKAPQRLSSQPSRPNSRTREGTTSTTVEKRMRYRTTSNSPSILTGSRNGRSTLHRKMSLERINRTGVRLIDLAGTSLDGRATRIGGCFLRRPKARGPIVLACSAAQTTIST